jgi:hypothetical protein
LIIETSPTMRGRDPFDDVYRAGSFSIATMSS